LGKGSDDRGSVGSPQTSSSTEPDDDPKESGGTLFLPLTNLFPMSRSDAGEMHLDFDLIELSNDSSLFKIK